MNADNPVILEMRGIIKRFPGVVALDNVGFDVRRGEVHALLGENGAGKSTLMKILAGVYEADAGEIIFKGQRVSFRTPKAAQVAGITTIHQELNQIPLLTVTENIYLGNEIMRGPLVNWPEMHKGARALLQRLHLNVDPRVLVGTLGVGQQQMIEVAKALHHRSDVIIMDEPTAALSLHEIDDLFTIIRQLRSAGVAIVYISHHLNEAFEIADRLTILRDGHHIATRDNADLSMDELIRLMVGRRLDEQFPKEAAPRGNELLRVEGLTQGDRLKDVSFSVHTGEVLGIAGLVGAGRTELLRAVFGADPIDAGAIYVDGKRVRIHSPKDAIRHGLVLLPEDRKQQGLVMAMAVRENMTLAVLRALARGPLIDRRKERALVQKYIQSIQIKVADPENIVSSLSGGNQQKIVLSKWMATEPRVLLFDEPTRGIDVGAKVEIYRLINRFVANGGAVVMVSSELPEVIGMADRIMVIHEGSVTGFVSRAEATQEILLEYATGHRRDEGHP